MWNLFRIFRELTNIPMESFTQTNNYITLEGDRYYHYDFGTKHTATKFAVIGGIHWYHSGRKIDE